MADGAASFTFADYLVFILSLAISLAIGVFQWWRSRGLDNSDFLMGGGKMSPVPVAMSLLAGIVSAISILGNSAEMYYYGSQLWMNTVGVIIGAVIVSVIIIPIIFPLKLISIYQYLELRWNSVILKKVSTVLQVINLFIFMGIALYAPSLALSSVTPISTNLSIIALGTICTIYASMGGAKAVVYTDSVQTFIMFGGVIAVIIQGCMEVGGGTASWNIDKQHGRIDFFNLDTDPLVRHTLLSTIVLGIYFSFNACGCSQPQFQRWASVSTLKRSHAVMAMNIAGLVVLWSLINYLGLVVFSVYADCDPLSAGYIQKIDQVTAYFVVDKLSYLPGIPGLFVAAVYSGVLSTISSGLNAIAAMVWEDILKPLSVFYDTSPERAKSITITISVVAGVLSIGIGISAGSMGGIVHVSYSIAGALGGPVAGIFLTAILCPWVKVSAALFGIICSALFNLWIVIGNFLYASPPSMLPLSTTGCYSNDNTTTTAFPDLNSTTSFPDTTTESYGNPSDVFPLYRLSYCYFGTIGALTTVLMSNVASCFCGFAEPSTIPEDTVNPSCLRFYKWLRSSSENRSIKENEYSMENKTAKEYNYPNLDNPSYEDSTTELKSL